MEQLYCDTGDDSFSDTGDGWIDVGFDEAWTGRQSFFFFFAVDQSMF